MKKLSVIISSFCVMLSYAQKVSDYKYVVVPSSFESFKKNNYGLSAFLTKNMKAKQYVVLSENRGQWPEEANVNPCSVLNADVINDSNFLRNKIILEFKDCNNKVVSSQKGITSIKEYEEGFKDALSDTFARIPVANPIQITEYKKENQATEAVPQVSEQKPQTSRAEKYSNGKLSLQKIQIDAAQFILVDGNSSVPFATFKETTKKDVFRVKLGSGESTTGYFENGNLVIEISKGNDEYSKEVFAPLK
ncbi:hypothetical protein [Chryseobacterium balustinum]|uniref:Uncharacterized protein n=1 Tax=Chryseobacterium balustinum TaxID=246 RepID=A0AAX2IKG0_9FLAO|nr:hypothetical protein [Chryseobacterium balustinum]AZB27890.1 hypothetical protein EB354_00620 [Chryseobacterium balustinum]SKB53448.1 hypothetical protein SAMN05421800_1036 [Chryseobacterium balustinum]SQA89903.1 Uncharacterised protein [Chryseobacterium balustinum]